MRRSRIGTIQLPDRRIELRYYIVGSRREGYGLEVIQELDGVTTRECCANITRSRQAARSLGKTLLRGVVFPGYMAELVAEWK